jgi:sugar/nucleoside kinase (ribokinase family)
MGRTLFVGDINIDIVMGNLQSLPVVDREVTCETYALVAGSSAVIGGCAFSHLGGDCAVAGLAGEDGYGDFVVQELKRHGVDTRWIRRSGEVSTGVTVNLIYRSTRTQVTYPGAIAAFDGSWIRRGVLGQFRHVHLAGPYLQTRFRPRIASLLGICRELGVGTSLDPQWDAAEEWEYMDQWLPLLSCFFANRDEALSITGRSSVEQAVVDLAEKTACVVVKAGSQGAYLGNRGKALQVPGFPIEPVDTTGAGDTFDAAFLFARTVKGMEAVEACRFANAAAARSCTFVGGTAASSRWEDVKAFMVEGFRGG